MKNKIATLLIFTLILGVTVVGCTGVEGPQGDEEIKLESLTVSCNNVNVTLDPRVELMAVIQYLSDYHIRITSIGFPFKYEVVDYFRDYLDHKAVQMYEEMGPQGFTYQVPSAFALCLTEDLEWDEDVQIPEEILQRGGGEENLREFAAALKDFSEQSNFAEFLTRYREFYSQSLQEVATKVNGYNFVTELEDYFGIKYNSFTILPVILYRTDATYSVSTVRDEHTDIYNILPPIRRSGNAQMEYVDEGMLRNWQRQDFSYSFVSPITDKYAAEVNQYEYLYEPVRNKMEKEHCNSWISCVNEHIARAVTVRLAYAESQEMGDVALAEAMYRGYSYIESLLEKLEEYESDRGEYPDFISFYPELLTAFAEVQ